MGIDMTMRVRLRGEPSAFDCTAESVRLQAALFCADDGYPFRLVDRAWLYDDYDKSNYAIRPEGETWVEVGDLGRHYDIEYERGNFLYPYLVWRWFKANHQVLGVIVCSDMGGVEQDTPPERMEETFDHWLRVQSRPYVERQKAART